MNSGTRFRHGRRRHARGVTLLELMIVVVVVGIIAAIAYPSYQEQVRKTRRADGKAALLNTAQLLERCYTRSATYVGCATVGFPATSDENHYLVTAVGGVTRAAFTLAATPQGPQAADADCGTLILTSLGQQFSQGGVTDPNNCW